METKLDDLSDLFKDFIEERKQKVTVDLIKILNEKPKLSSDKIRQIVNDIHFYYQEFPDTNENYYDKFLNIYDDYINEEDMLDILLNISNKSTFKKFATKHYDILKEFFKRTIFIPPHLAGDLDDLDDFQAKVDYLYKGMNYNTEWCNFSNNTLFEIYYYFGNEIKIFNYNELEKYSTNQLVWASEEDLEKLFKYETENNSSKLNIYTLLEIFNCKYDSENKYDLSRISSIITNEKTVITILDLIRDIYKNHNSYSLQKNILISGDFYSKIYCKILRENIVKITVDDYNSINDIFSLNYLKALNELETLSKEKQQNNPLYLKCFKLFLEEFLKTYNDPITNEALHIIEILFKRVINRKDFFFILLIDNFKTLYHYYKTDEYLPKINASLDIIKNNNSKQYNNLKKVYLKHHHLKSLSSKTIEDIMKSLALLGYDLSKKIIMTPSLKLNYIISHLNNKDSNYISLLKNILSKDISEILKEKEFSTETFLACFALLHEQGFKKITPARILKSMTSLSYVLLPTNRHIEKNLENLNLIAKGNPLLEKTAGIKLYDKYRFRIKSSIPDISGTYSNCQYTMVNLHDPEIISNGIGNYLLPNNKTASSCLTPNGKAASCLNHGALNPNGRFFKITDHNKIIAYSWVWRAGDVLCFDNIEVTDNLLKVDNYEELLYNIYKKVSEELISKTKEEKRGIKLIVLGRNKIDFPNKHFDNLEEIDDQELFKPNSKEELYLKDSSEKQLILAGTKETDIKTEDVEPIYKHHRSKVESFADLDQRNLSLKINSIYFDYCLKNNQKYQTLDHRYESGYIGEDWFVGTTKDKIEEFYFRGEDERLFKEAANYTSIIKKEPKKNVATIHPDKEIISYLLDEKNFEIDQEIKSYLANRKKDYFNLLSEYYTHSPSSFSNFVSILESNAITSAEYGNHPGGSGCNGNYYISVAKVNSEIYRTYLSPATFIITSNICAFNYNNQFSSASVKSEFKNSSYPFRKTNNKGEYHVLNEISLDKVKAIFTSTKNITNLAQIIYIQELFANDKPLIEIDDNSYIDKEAIKKYCKLKK